MRKTLFFFLSILIASALSAPLTPAQTVTQIFGGQLACPTNVDFCFPPPLQQTVLCATTCPRQIRPSFTDVNRLWGSAMSGSGICRTSTDGGTTWGSCTAQPFSSGGKENYAGAADGSVIGTGRVGADCFIARSVNNATTWTTVHTIVGGTCGGGLAGATQLTCFVDGTCTFIFTTSAGVMTVIRSGDNGINWAATFTGLASASTFHATAINFSTARVAVPPTGSAFRGVEGLGSTYIDTASWAAGFSCWGAYHLLSTAFAVCQTGLGTTYNIRDNVSGTLLHTPSFPQSAVPFDNGGPSIGVGNLFVYTLGTMIVPPSSTRIGTYFSQDGGASYLLLTQTAIVGSGLREGDFWQHPLNSCLYWSAGSPTIQVARICQ